MAVEEVLSLIPASEYQRIKDRDASPMFKAYVIGHEGESRGKAIGMGTVVARWMRSAIENLYKKLHAGLQVFHNHALTNEHEGRIPIGEVVSKALRTIGDKLATIAIVYIKPEFRNLPLDIASIEADVRFKEDRARAVYDADVDEITGIALGNSSMNSPGFEGATLLAQVQAFAKKSKHTTHFAGGNTMDFTIEDVKTFIKAEHLKPSDLFGVESLSDDSSVKGLIDGATKKAVAGEYAHRKREEETFDAKKKELETENKTLKDEVSASKLEVSKTKIPGLFQKAVTDRKLSDVQKKFIEKRLEKNFIPKAVETLEADFNKHVDTELDEFKAQAEVFGVKIDDKQDDKQKDNKDEKDRGTGPADKKTDGRVEDKYLNPETNPLIARI
jgi:hypothetical protein